MVQKKKRLEWRLILQGLAETVSAQNLALARLCGVFVFRSHRQTHRMNFRCQGGTKKSPARWLGFIE
jgi:hypothetical protein